jgi:hypothetical protein
VLFLVVQGNGAIFPTFFAPYLLLIRSYSTQYKLFSFFQQALSTKVSAIEIQENTNFGDS